MNAPMQPDRSTHFCGLCGEHWINPNCPHSREERTAWLIARIDRKRGYHGNSSLPAMCLFVLVILVAVMSR